MVIHGLSMAINVAVSLWGKPIPSKTSHFVISAILKWALTNEFQLTTSGLAAWEHRCWKMDRALSLEALCWDSIGLAGVFLPNLPNVIPAVIQVSRPSVGTSFPARLRSSTWLARNTTSFHYGKRNPGLAHLSHAKPKLSQLWVFQLFTNEDFGDTPESLHHG